MKRNKTKQILACVLSVLAVAVYMPANVGTGGITATTAITAKAEDRTITAQGNCGANVKWALYSDGTLEITGTGAMADYNDTSSVPWLNNKASIKSVKIGEGVTSIGVGAFYSCQSLTSVTIPEGVTNIGNYAFYLCKSLTSVTIPEGVTNIGNYAFCNCKSLTSITIPASVESIGVDAFYVCSAMTDVYCYPDPAKLTWNESGRDDFKKNNATKIHVFKSYADDYTKKFGTEVRARFVGDLPVTVVASGNCGAEGNEKNVKWTLYRDGKLEITGTGAMADYDYYDDNIYPAWYTMLENIKSVKIGEGVTSIGGYAFCNCKSLTSVTIPASVKSIGEDAFYNCKSLTSITIPASVKSIGVAAFKSCKFLTSITIPEGVTSIEIDAFYNCTAMTDVYCYPDPAKLTWNEYECDDFKDDGSTKIHVPQNYLTGYTNRFSTGNRESDVNGTFVGDLPATCATFATAPTANTLTYSSGESQELVTAGTATNGTAYYKLADDKEWSTSVPTATNAGTYTVQYYAKGDFCDDSEVSSVEVTIEKGTYTPTPDMSGWISGKENTASVSNVPKEVLDENPKITYEYKSKGADDSQYSTVVPTQAGEYTVRVTISESSNYKTATATKDFEIALPEGFVNVGEEVPTKEGNLFAGYFTDETCTKSYIGTDGAAYARFMDAKKYLIANVDDYNVSGSKGTLQFSTIVPDSSFKEVRFEIKIGNSTKKVKADKLFMADDGCKAVYTLNNITKKYFGKEVTITPSWTTLDGTIITGTSTTYTIPQQ